MFTFISFFVFCVAALTALTAADDYSNPTCEPQACGECFASCPSFDGQVAELRDCKSKLNIASSKYTTEAELDCRFPKCASILLPKLCGVAAPNRLDNTIRRFKERLYLLPKYARGKQNALSHERVVYDRKIEKSLNRIHHEFNNALSRRQTYNQLKEQVESIPFRKDRLSVVKQNLEMQGLWARASFWRTRARSLRAAVQTSRLSLKAARDALQREYANVAADAILSDALKSDLLSKEHKAELLLGLTKRATIQLKQAKTIVANVKAQRRFIHEANEEIHSLLVDLGSRIKKNTINVPCGPLALSDIITDSLIASNHN